MHPGNNLAVPGAAPGRAGDGQASSAGSRGGRSRASASVGSRSSRTAGATSASSSGSSFPGPGFPSPTTAGSSSPAHAPPRPASPTTTAAAGGTALLSAAAAAVPSRAGGGNTSNAGSSGSSSRSSSAGSSSRSSSVGSSSSGFSSRSGSRSSSGGAASALGGLICILLIIVVVVVLVVLFKRKGAALGGAGGAAPDTPPPPPPPPLPRRPEVDEALNRIRQRDPAFDEAGFLNGVATSFALVQRAWCEQLPAESRKVMADGIWLRHRTQIEEMAAAGRRNVLEDLHIGRSEIVDCVTDADSDSITVRIHAYSRDYDVAAPSEGQPGGQIVRGDRVMRLWTEDWTFTRASSATTKAGSGTRQNCPNCGAPLDLDAAGTCAYCKQLVMAGAYDWVLSRIEQVYSTSS